MLDEATPAADVAPGKGTRLSGRSVGGQIRLAEPVWQVALGSTEGASALAMDMAHLNNITPDDFVAVTRRMKSLGEAPDVRACCAS